MDFNLPISKTQNRAKLAYSVKELVQLLGVSQRKLRQEISEGALQHCRIGRRVVITHEQLQKYIDCKAISKPDYRSIGSAILEGRRQGD